MYVYLLRSTSHPDQRYVGLTGDLKKRLAEHNAGKSPHTSKYVPGSSSSPCTLRTRPGPKPLIATLSKAPVTPLPIATSGEVSVFERS